MLGLLIWKKDGNDVSGGICCGDGEMEIIMGIMFVVSVGLSTSERNAASSSVTVPTIASTLSWVTSSIAENNRMCFRLCFRLVFNI